MILLKLPVRQCLCHRSIHIGGSGQESRPLANEAGLTRQGVGVKILIFHGLRPRLVPIGAAAIAGVASHSQRCVEDQVKFPVLISSPYEINTGDGTPVINYRAWGRGVVDQLG